MILESPPLRQVKKLIIYLIHIIYFTFKILVIKTVSDVRITKKEADSKTLDAVSERTLISQLKKLTQKNKEDNLQMMMRILIDGATQQDHYLNDLERSDAFMNESEEFDIFDV